MLRPISILDIGGTANYWKQMSFTAQQDVHITILNIKFESINEDCLKFVPGDARDLSMFRENEFDIAFSNSVIEHVGDFDDKKRMVNELRRVSKHYFIQTPNYYFPFEPHFLFPFFQFFPRSVKIFLVKTFDMGWYEKTNDSILAQKLIDSVKLLKKNELKELFPEATIHPEKFLGLTKSFTVVDRTSSPLQ